MKKRKIGGEMAALVLIAALIMALLSGCKDGKSNTETPAPFDDASTDVKTDETQEVTPMINGDTETIDFDNGDHYEGETANGQPNGKGVYTYADGDVYDGDFVDGKRNGKGVFTWGADSSYSGDVYDGDWVDGNRTGKGVYTWANGNVYDGDFVDGKRTGKGVMTYADGTVKSGEWKDGEFVG